ncbi:acyl-CoA-binding domain-containing protein 6-like [Teleopsis dalmanni]|uniref:acyl-CoA-binding domain-containing protein 6-like n=1 Tax=Teleopsis dalmanni TaxID=139649 RepID=UPI0018CE5E19|nr:acyl-CoA-binding domain-containing protein 6-like [Teleopsis dalmanni]
MSDFSDSDAEIDIIDENFASAADHVQSIHTTLLPNDLLELYGYYKQATIGQCNAEKPSIFNMQGRAKWNAWNELGNMSTAIAKNLYIEKVKQLDPLWQPKLISAQKYKPAFSWVVHSTELPPNDVAQKAEHEKDAFDFVKEANIAGLQMNLKVAQLSDLDENGMGLIHWAADRNAFDILLFLLNSGANVDLRDGEEQTALHYAASCGHIDCIRVLLSFNANSKLLDKNGETCLDVADNDDIRMLLSS